MLVSVAAPAAAGRTVPALRRRRRARLRRRAASLRRRAARHLRQGRAEARHPAEAAECRRPFSGGARLGRLVTGRWSGEEEARRRGLDAGRRRRRRGRRRRRRVVSWRRGELSLILMSNNCYDYTDSLFIRSLFQAFLPTILNSQKKHVFMKCIWIHSLPGKLKFDFLKPLKIDILLYHINTE